MLSCSLYMSSVERFGTGEVIKAKHVIKSFFFNALKYTLSHICVCVILRITNLEVNTIVMDVSSEMFVYVFNSCSGELSDKNRHVLFTYSKDVVEQLKVECIFFIT